MTFTFPKIFILSMITAAVPAMCAVMYGTHDTDTSYMWQIIGIMSAVTGISGWLYWGHVSDWGGLS